MAAAEVCSSRASLSARRVYRVTSTYSNTVPLPFTLLWLHQTWSCNPLSESKLSAKPLLFKFTPCEFLHGFVPVAGRSQPKPLANTSLSNGNCISADLQILPICAASHWKSHRAVCQMWGDERGVMRGCLFWPEEVTYKVTTFSRLGLGVLVNPYPSGMVITVNQNRKISQKAQFRLLSQQYLTLLRKTFSKPP